MQVINLLSDACRKAHNFDYMDFHSVTGDKRYGVDPEEQSEWINLMQSKYNLP